MSQNRSSAVMAQRREPPDSLDFFPTPPWATRALCENVLPRLALSTSLFSDAWDPCCGQGHMSGPLSEYFPTVFQSDIFDYGIGLDADFLDPGFTPSVDAFIFNPPFNQAVDFVLKAIGLSPAFVAALVRNQWTAGIDRYLRLFDEWPPTAIAHFSDRVPMVKGRWAINASTATDYSWFVWDLTLRTATPSAWSSQTLWIPPHRRQALTRQSDFETYHACSLVPLALRNRIDAYEAGELELAA